MTISADDDRNSVCRPGWGRSSVSSIIPPVIFRDVNFYLRDIQAAGMILLLYAPASLFGEIVKHAPIIADDSRVVSLDIHTLSIFAASDLFHIWHPDVVVYILAFDILANLVHLAFQEIRQALKLTDALISKG